MPRNARIPPLTRREVEVLSWVARGKSTADIAQILDITARTVNQHVLITMRKLSAANRAHAVARAIKLQLITPE